ncbi:MAG: GNAT family N-acetyltransferase [Clostridia bacterium]|nr:GNAT family N-acetyltransferase [Clostridia bacterium]
MIDSEILRIALEQSAEDLGCRPEDFTKSENAVFPLRLGKNARKYYKEPIVCDLVSYGSNVAAAVTPAVEGLVSEYLSRYPFYECLETPHMHWLNERLEQMGYRICFMAEYFLPDQNGIPDNPCAYDVRLLGQTEFSSLYRPEWSNALCSERRELDRLAVGAYDGGKLVGLAGCSADCEMMWQIGVDVLPDKRGQGIASALTARLASEILKRDKVPFYCSAWSNLRSVRNALKSGFLPAWAELTVKPADVVDGFNRREGDLPMACTKAGS